MPSYETRLGRAKYRAWHRGTREADYMIGGYFDRYHAGWDNAQLAWFEALLDQEDHDILSWIMNSAEVPEKFAGEQMVLMQKLDYVTI